LVRILSSISVLFISLYFGTHEGSIFFPVIFRKKSFKKKKKCEFPTQNKTKNMAAPPQPRQSAKAPELGSFPLDHFRECKNEVQEYYKCLESHDNLAPMCRDLVKKYLQCRMDRGLMNKADVDNFGLPNTDFVPTRMHREDLRRDAKRAGATAQLVGPVWESKFRSEDLKHDDGYEAIKGTTTPAPEEVKKAQMELEKTMNAARSKH
jgi:cytochrome c oxidase assembly protein subunit 19